MHASILTVHVHGVRGLLDMLRYDTCCPADEAQSVKIERLMSGREPAQLDHVILLRRYSSSGSPASPRWQSFGCTVLDERSPDEPQLTSEELLALLRQVAP